MGFDPQPFNWSPSSIPASAMAGCYALFPVPGLTEINITADSLPQGLGIDSQPDLIAVRSPNCTRVDGDLNYNDAAGFQISNCPNLTTVEFPRATTFSSDVYLNNNALLTSVDLSAATTFSGDFYLSGNAALTNVDLSAATTFSNAFNVNGNALLTSVDLSAATTFGGYYFLCTGNAALTSVDLSAATTFGGGFNLSGNALTESVVNTLLTMLVSATTSDNVTPWHGTCDLSGGTSEAPTVGPPDGIAAVGTLTARFATVTTN